MKTKPATARREEDGGMGDLFWIGTNIYRLRATKGLTQESLAKKAGVTARALGVETVRLYRRRRGELGV